MIEAVEIVQLLVVGLGVGLIIAIGAMGLSLAYGVEKYPNVAHGHLMVVGMFVGYEFSRLVADPLSVDRSRASVFGLEFSFGWDFLGAMVVAMAAGALIAVVSELLVFRTLRNRGAKEVTFIIASLGLAILLRGLVQTIWGTQRFAYYGGTTPALDLFGIRLDPDIIMFLFITLLVTLLLYYMLFKTKYGKALRAMSDNPDLASISGINTGQIRTIMWVMAGALGGLAGALHGMQVEINYTFGLLGLLPLFAAVILGGVGNPWGALVGALIIGVSQEVSTAFIPTSFKTVVPFTLMILVLLLRPQGIFGKKS